MIREEVMLWAGLVLLVIMAFVLMPSYERFKNSKGEEVDVDPNAPAMPDWLKPVDEKTGKPAESFWNMFGLGNEHFDVGSGKPTADPSAPPDPADQKTVASFFDKIEKDYTAGKPSVVPAPALPGAAPPPAPAGMPGAAPLPGPSGMPGAAPPPGPSTQASDKPSGVTALPSVIEPGAVPAPAGDPFKLPDTGMQVLDTTLPPPDYGAYGPGGGGVHGGDKYVLKSSLQPCACPSSGAGGARGGSAVPGGLDSYPPTGDDAIRRPSGFQSGGGENEPVGYLNSFGPFMK